MYSALIPFSLRVTKFSNENLFNDIEIAVSQKEKHQYSILTHIYIWNLERW